MNPVSARPIDELQRVKRNVFCEHYEACLDIALFKGWRSFSCGHCANFSQAQKSCAEWQGDALCCGDLISVVFGLSIMPETDL
jgi:hypothetical protein